MKFFLLLFKTQLFLKINYNYKNIRLMEPPNGMGYQAYVNYLMAQEKPTDQKK